MNYSLSDEQKRAYRVLYQHSENGIVDDPHFILGVLSDEFSAMRRYRIKQIVKSLVWHGVLTLLNGTQYHISESCRSSRQYQLEESDIRIPIMPIDLQYGEFSRAATMLPKRPH